MSNEKLRADIDFVPDQKNIEIYSIIENPSGLNITLRNMETGDLFALGFETYEFFQNVSNELTYCERWNNAALKPYHSIYWVENSNLQEWLSQTSGGGLLLRDEVRGPLKHLVIMTIEKCCEVVFYGDVVAKKFSQNSK